MSRILFGAYIRISELTKSLQGTLFHGNEVRRALRSPKFLPHLLRDENVLIFGYSPTFLDLFLFKMVKNRCHIFFDVADIPHMQLLYFGVGKETDGKHKRAFLQLVDVADILLFVSPTLMSLSGLNTLSKKKTLIVPNASNPDFFKSTPLPRVKDKVILCVSGYAPMRGIELLIDAFRLIRKRHRNVSLRLVGYNMPLKFGKEEGVIIERNRFYSHMPQVYSESHVCVIPHKKNPYMDSALPIKLFDAMAASRPVVVTNCFEMRRLVESEKCGISTDCEATSLSEAIDYVLSNKVAAEMGLRGREAVERRHSWAHRAETIKQFLSKI